MPTIVQIGDALEAAIATLGVRAQQETDVAPNVTGSALAAIIEYRGTTYDAAFRGAAAEVMYRATFVGSRVSVRTTRDALFALCDPTPGATGTIYSITGSLGSVVVDCRLVSTSELRDYTIAAGDYIGLEALFAVMPS